MSHGIYAKNELKRMQRFQSIKSVILWPFIWLCTKFGISANAITISGGIIALLGLGASIATNETMFFLIGLRIHLFFDGLDGSVARNENSQSQSGTLLDIYMDHIGIIASGIFLLFFTGIESWLIVLYLLFYTITVFCAYILGKLKNPYGRILRPRLFVYVAITILTFGVVYWIVIISTLILFIHSIDGLFRLYQHTKDVH